MHVVVMKSVGHYNVRTPSCVNHLIKQRNWHIQVAGGHSSVNGK